MDSNTDADIQKLIATVFQNSTMLIIAHRLETLDCCDRILRLERGSPTTIVEVVHGQI